MRQPGRGMVLIGTWMALALPAPVAGQDPAPTVAAPWDPTTTDVSPVDVTFPPALAAVSIPSGGSTMNGRMYLADGPGPHATVIFLHDVPGYETNTDLAQAVRRAGYNALVFHYRGAWGSGGEFVWLGAAEDAAAAIDFVASPEAAERYRADAARIHLVGDGFGSWAALRAAADRQVGCIGTIAAWNPAVRAEQLRAGGAAAWRDALVAAADPGGGPLTVGDPAELLGALTADPGGYDLMRAVSGARGRSVLLITSARADSDPAGETLMVGAALAGAGAEAVERFILNDDPAFSASRVQVARTLVSWLERQCPAW